MCSQKNRNLLRRLKSFKSLKSLLLREPLGNKGFYSVIFSFLLSAFCLLAFSSCDKEEMLMNKQWQLQSVSVNGEPLNDSLRYNIIPFHTYYNFFYANVLEVSAFIFELGEWRVSSDGFYLFNNSMIKMSFSILHEEYEMTATIKKLTGRELRLEYVDNGNTYLLKLYSSR